jgi:hypothetical protein
MNDNSPVVGAMMHAVESLLRQAKWRTEPAGEQPRQKEAAKFLDECLDDMSHTWDELMSEVLSMLPYGWAYFEIVYKIRCGNNPDPTHRSRYDDGRVGLRKISIRAQDTLDRWEIDRDGTILGMWQSDPYAGSSLVFLPIQRSLLFRTTSKKNNPEGFSALRRGYRPWYFAKRIEEIEAIGIERDLNGLPLVHLPAEMLSPGATPAQKATAQTFKTLVQQIRRDEREGIVFPAETNAEGKPTGYKISLLGTGSRRAIDTGAVVIRHEQRIAMTMLAEFIFLGTSSVGSYSLASTKTSLFTMSLGGLMENIASTFNRYLIPRLMALNGFTADEYPTIVHGDIEAPPLEEVATFVNQLVQAGVLTPDDSLERKLRELGNLPERPHEEEPAPGQTIAPEPGVDTTATTAPTTPAAAGTERIQAVALNGAQVTAAQGIVQSVAAGQLPRATGVAMMIAFFGMTAADVERIMGDVGRGFSAPSPPQGQ